MKNIQTTVPRMRTISEAIKEIKKCDPNSALTEKALRRLVKTGEISSIRIGAKHLINIDLLMNYLYTGKTTRKAR